MGGRHPRDTRARSTLSMERSEPHVAILGAGPIGLEAALAAAERGLPCKVYEA